MTADLTAALARIGALAGNASKAPWLYGGQGWVFSAGPVPESADGGFEDLVAEFYIEPDAAFIAEARTTAPALAAVVRAVLAVHQPRRDAPGSLVTWEFCSCGATEAYVFDDGGFATGPARYPCATRRAITTAWEAQR